MSLIVVEGCDGSGKSTLLENARLQIPKRYFVLVRHSCRPLELSDALQFIRAVDYSSSHTGLDVIADRHPLISEPIYGPILRGGHLFEDHLALSDEQNRIDKLRGSVDRVIYCRPPRHQVQANIEKLPQLSGVREKILNLLSAYDEVMHNLQISGVRVVWYDYTENSYPLEKLFFGELT